MGRGGKGGRPNTFGKERLREGPLEWLREKRKRRKPFNPSGRVRIL